MKIRGYRTVWLHIVLLAFIFVGSLQNFAVAEAVGPGWHMTTQTDPVSPETAKAYYSNLSKTIAQKPSTKTLMQAEALVQSAAESTTPEITELARALQHDPKQIYEYVHNHINYVPYFGSLKGATLTYLDGAGNDFDQASLMIALLRASGYTAQYVYGQMIIPDHSTANQMDMQHWLSIDANNSIVSQVLANGGIPASYFGASWLVDRVWVETTIDGVTYDLDPAFKVYEETSGVNIQAAMGYNRTALTQAAGGTVGTDFVQNLNETGLKTSLDAYSLNLANYIRTNYPNAEIEEIVGGRKIKPEYLDQLPTGLNFSDIPQSYWTDIPATYIHTIRIKHGGIDQTFNIADLAGKRLSMTYRNASQGAGAMLVSAATSLAAEQTPPALSTPTGTSTPLLPSGGAVATPATTIQTQGINASSPSLKGGSLAIMAAAATSTWDFGRTYPTGYVDGTMSLKNTNATTIKLVVTLLSNTSGAYAFVSGGGTYNVAPGVTAPIKVRFKGTGQTAGTKTAQLRVQWYSGTTLFADVYTNLTGIVASPLTLGGYGMNVQTFLNEPYTATCRLQNNGTKVLTIASIATLTGTNPTLFSIVSGGGTGTIAAGGYRDI
ncbi:MAG: transglutaminase-like domain-containing protein, partial [Desulfobulbaceae bacterium]|nr:transglutaminase-like domain-containing protein [Desulfobulbaceae bacterium]